MTDQNMWTDIVLHLCKYSIEFMFTIYLEYVNWKSNRITHIFDECINNFMFIDNHFLVCFTRKVYFTFDSFRINLLEFGYIINHIPYSFLDLFIRFISKRCIISNIN